MPSSPLLRRAAFTSSGVTVLSLFSRVSFITFFTIQQQLFLSDTQDTTVHHSTHSRLLSISHHYTLATVATDVKETNLDHNSAFTDNKNNKNNNNINNNNNNNNDNNNNPHLNFFKGTVLELRNKG